MAIDLTPEQRETGTANYVRTAEGLTRRGFLKSMAVAGAAAVPVSAAVYFGYESLHGRPVKAALIGGGDEGGVLVGEHNPEYLEFVAVCDIRPSNMKRIFDGEPAGLRKGFKKVYGKNAESQIRKYADYKEMLKNEKRDRGRRHRHAALLARQDGDRRHEDRQGAAAGRSTSCARS